MIMVILMFNMYEVILLFFIYSFIGWVWEVILSFFESKKFINRGFLIGPFLPIYGFGGFIATVFFSKYAPYTGSIQSELLNITCLFVATTIICSILEYFTSWLMEKLFNNRWWDYSDLKFNINGRICLFCSFGFGLGCTLCLKVVNPFLRQIINIPNNTLKIIDLILILYIFIDTMTSFKIINNFKNISNSIVEDSTEKITTMVKKTILDNYNVLYRRLVESFPTMKTNNKLSLLRNKILNEQKKVEKALYKLDIRKDKIKKLEKELKNKKDNNIVCKITNLFNKK